MNYGNLAGYDLMQVLGAEGRIDLWELLKTYLTEPNYPLLIVTEQFNSTSGNAALTVRQQRYISLPNTPVDTLSDLARAHQLRSSRCGRRVDS